MSSGLDLVNITFTYNNGRKLFDNYSYRQPQGNIALWSGPSGYGKSTLAQIAVGHLEPDSGKTLWNGKELDEPGPDRFYVGTENDLFSWKKLRDQFAFLEKNVNYDRLLPLTEVEKMAEKLEIKDLFNNYPSQISTGEMRRFQLLRSLMINSELMIFDETFSALDRRLKNRIFPQLVEYWKARRNTVIIISHESDTNFNYRFDQLVDFSDFPNDK